MGTRRDNIYYLIFTISVRCFSEPEWSLNKLKEQFSFREWGLAKGKFGKFCLHAVCFYKRVHLFKYMLSISLKKEYDLSGSASASLQEVDGSQEKKKNEAFGRNFLCNRFSERYLFEAWVVPKWKLLFSYDKGGRSQKCWSCASHASERYIWSFHGVRARCLGVARSQFNILVCRSPRGLVHRVLCGKMDAQAL